MLSPADVTETTPLIPESTSPPYYSDDNDGETIRGAENDILDDPNSREGGEEHGQDGVPEMKKKLPIIMPALAFGIFLAACDGTVVASSYGRIGSDLHALNRTPWLATAYLTTLTCFQPLYGKLSDIFGRKPILLVSYVAFAVGCLVCGLAPNMPIMIVGRALTGIGGASNAMISIILSDIVPLRERGTWSAVTNLIFAAGASAGAPLGGMIADTVGWRWAFLGQIPICILAFAAVSFALQLPKTGDTSLKKRASRVDFLGAILLMSSVFTLILGQDLGSNGSWRAPGTIVTNLLFQPLVALFLVVERKYAVDPLIPLRLLFDPKLLTVNLTILFSLAAWYGIIFYVPLFLQVTHFFTAFDAGLRLLPGIGSAVAGSFIVGFFIKRTGNYYWASVVSYASMLVGCILIIVSISVLHARPTILFLGMIVGGTGNGGSLTSNTIAALAQTSRTDQAVVISLGFLFRSLGTTLGLSMLSTMMQQSLRWRLRVQLGGGRDVDEIVRKVRQSLDYLDELSPQLQFAIRKAYGASIAIAFAGVLGFVSVALICSIFIKETPLGRKAEDEVAG